MISPRIVPDKTNDQFWSVVRGCLRQFHKMTAEMTRRKAAQLRKRIEGMPNDTMEFFYHFEPFDVACDIANQQLDLEKYLDRYLQIRDGKDANGVFEQVKRRSEK